MSEYTLYHGDCLDIMPTLDAGSIDTVISDPPYGLSFMGKDWDHGVPGVPFWAEALRVAKPGAMLLAFGGTRTQHRLTVAIEDAGWIIRDVVMWIYGSGFPKSHNISKHIDKAAGAEREVVGVSNRHGGENKVFEGQGGTGFATNGKPDITAPATEAAQLWDGYGTALKPAYEPIIVAMKPVDKTFAHNAIVHGVAGMWIDGGRVGITDGATMARNNKPGSNGWKNSSGGPNAAALNGEPSGRWPANIIHDGSDEVTAGFPVTTSGKNTPGKRGGTNSGMWSDKKPQIKHEHEDTGSAARYFYCAKASRAERNAGLDGMEERVSIKLDQRRAKYREDRQTEDVPVANYHPTVKPIALMRYLARITRTPTGGIVLDPFMGSGSTGAACMMEGRDFVGIDLEADYVEIARRRIEHAKNNHPTDGEMIPINGKGNYTDLPMFADVSE